MSSLNHSRFVHGLPLPLFPPFARFARTSQPSVTSASTSAPPSDEGGDNASILARRRAYLASTSSPDLTRVSSALPLPLTTPARARPARVGAPSLDAVPEEASAGMAQKVSFHLRAYAHHYALVIDEPRRLSRSRVFVYATATGLGKFMAAYGAFLAAEGFLNGTPGTGAGGCVIAAAGTASFVTGALLFTSTVKVIEPTVAKSLKVWSLAGGAVLVSAYACKGALAAKAAPHSLGFDLLGRSLNFAGVAMMQISFPAFCASAQAVYGTIIEDRWWRLFVGWMLWDVFGNAPPVFPTSRSTSEGIHVGTQLGTAICSFASLFGAGLVLSTAFDSLGRSISQAPRWAEMDGTQARRHSSPDVMLLPPHDALASDSSAASPRLA